MILFLIIVIATLVTHFFIEKSIVKKPLVGFTGRSHLRMMKLYGIMGAAVSVFGFLSFSFL